jgi:hypothetical protein
MKDYQAAKNARENHRKRLAAADEEIKSPISNLVLANG